MKPKLYAERDITDCPKIYSAHVSAMTGEKLHSKSDIAAELAYRDDLLAKAYARLNQIDSHFTWNMNDIPSLFYFKESE